MSPFVDYWLKANLFLLFFYGCYWLLLRRHTFLALNRAYLLGSVGLALLLPLLHIPGLTFPWPWENSDPVAATVSLDTLTLVGTVTNGAAPSPGPNWPVLGGWLFGLGSVVLLLRTGWRTLSLLTLIRQWTRHTLTDHVLVLPDTNRVPTFSFFCYLVLNPDDVQTEAIRQHELVHIRQAHTLDVLLLELVQAFCWPNPALIGYRRAIRQVHEYLADRDTAPQTATHRDAYARFLVSYAFHLPQPGPATDSLAHSFGPPRPDSPTLKQRIQMLYQQHTRPRALWKYALVFPLATLLLAMTNKPDPASENRSTHKQELTFSVSDTTGTQLEGTVREPSGGPLPGATVAIIGSRKGTTTDAQGHFKINAPANARLVVSFVGFKPQEIEVGRGQHVFGIMLAKEDGSSASQPTADVPTSQTVTTGNSYSAVEDEVFGVVENNPMFPGGLNKLSTYVSANIRYPEEARQKHIQGKVFVNFVINTDGSIDRLRVLKGIGGGCDEEAIRVVSTMPNWTPGRQNGRPVAVRYNLPILFQLGETQKAEQTLPSSQELQNRQSRMDSLTKVNLIPDDNGLIPILDKTQIRLINPANQPLYLWDGKEISQEEMKLINSNNIQSIDVLKGASATSQYGEKGRYGVVRITSREAAKKK